MKYYKYSCFWIVSCICFWGCMNNAQKVVVNKITTAPLIDGRIDTIWNNSNWENINCIRWTRLTDVKPENISAAYKVLWDTGNCYLLFRVTDDVKFSGTYITEVEKKFDLRLPELDGVELFFDPLNKKTTSFDPGSFNNKKFTYHTDSISSTVSTPTNTSVEGISFAQSDTPNGYMLEVKFPWRILQVKPENNKEIGFEVNVIDNDNYAPSPDILPKRETVLGWNDRASQDIHKRTDVYGTLILKEE
jgi:hypothetical protein